KDDAKDQIPVIDEDLRHGDDDERRCRKTGTEVFEHVLEGRDDEDHDDREHDERDDEDGDRIDQRRLDLVLDRHRLFLIDGEAIEQRLQNTAGFAGLDQVAVERVEIERVLAERGREAGTGLDVGADVGQQARHARIGAAAGDDVEGLDQGYAGAHHGRQLAREDGDVLLLDRLAAAHAALLHLVHHHALAAQAGAHHGFAAGAHLAADGLAVLVLAFPLEDDVLDSLCSQCRCHNVSEDRCPSFDCRRYSLVTEITSSSVVMPDRTLRSPDWRRSRTPSRCAWTAMSVAMPAFRMILWISSLMGITWYMPTRPL